MRLRRASSIVVVLLLSAACQSLPGGDAPADSRPSAAKAVDLELGTLCDAQVEEPLSTALKEAEEDTGTDPDGRPFRNCSSGIVEGRMVSADLRRYASKEQWMDDVAEAVASSPDTDSGGPCSKPKPVARFARASLGYVCTTYADTSDPELGSINTASISGWFPPFVLDCSVSANAEEPSAQKAYLARLAVDLCVAERNHRRR